MGAKPINIYIEGANNSGRRSLLSWLQFETFHPLVFERKKLVMEYAFTKHNKTKLLFWIGGKLLLFRTRLNEAQGIILIVDATDPKSFEDAYKAFDDTNGSLERKLPVLVFLNKQDLLGALPKEVIIEQIKLKKYEVEYHVEEISIKEGKGIKEGLDWLINAIKNDKKGKK